MLFSGIKKPKPTFESSLDTLLFSRPQPLSILPSRPRALQQFSLLILSLKTGSQVNLSASSILYCLGRLLNITKLSSYHIVCLFWAQQKNCFSWNFTGYSEFTLKTKIVLVGYIKTNVFSSLVARDETFSRSFSSHLFCKWFNWNLNFPKAKSIREGLLVFVLEIICFL